MTSSSHGSQRGQPVLLGEVHVAGADELLAQAIAQQRQQLAMPLPRVAPPGAVIGDLAAGRHAAQAGYLFAQAAAALFEIRLGGIAEPDLVDDRQQRHLEQDGVQPRPADGQLDLARMGGRCGQAQILAIQMEQRQEVGEVRLDEAQAAQVIHFVLAQPQPAQRIDLARDLIDELRQVHAGSAAFEAVIHLRCRVLVQHRLHHGEFVQIGVEQRMDDHAAGLCP